MSKIKVPVGLNLWGPHSEELLCAVLAFGDAVGGTARPAVSASHQVTGSIHGGLHAGFPLCGSS